jgi:hypothetical protein
MRFSGRFVLTSLVCLVVASVADVFIVYQLPQTDFGLVAGVLIGIALGILAFEVAYRITRGDGDSD